MIDIQVHPQLTTEWDRFLTSSPPFSIALDGYVRGPPRFSVEGPRANFNHHEGVDRLGTRSTTGQVYVAIKQALFDTFREGGAPRAILHINDCDQDISVAVWLFENAERILGLKSEPLITRLINVTDLLDTTAGAYPLDPSTSIMRELAWIHVPYTDVRAAGRVSTMDAKEIHDVVKTVGERITRYALGQGGKVDLDMRFTELGGGPGWALIREDGVHARSALFARGVRAFVAYNERSAGGCATVSIGKMSPYVTFPIEAIFAHLNRVEGLENESDRWGGGDTIGGSPRKAGTKLTPADLEREVNRVLKET